MQKVTFIICDSGDGSNHLEWFYPALTESQLEFIQESDLDRYQSGDGLQVRELVFPDEFSVEGWLAVNSIYNRTYGEWLEDNKSSID